MDRVLPARIARQATPTAGVVSRRFVLSAVLAVTTAIGPGTAGGQRAAPPQGMPSLEERLSVREVELLLEPPLGKGLRDLRPQLPDPKIPGSVRFVVPPHIKGMGDLGPADLLVIEDGRARPVLRLEPLPAKAHPWSLRIYFDLVLAHPDTVFEAAIALAYQAGELAELGAVEIVVADPGPRTVLAPSRDAPVIREALAALAEQSRHDPRAGLFAPFQLPPPATVRRQCDRLVTSLAATTTNGPHALLLIAESPPLSGGELHRLAAASTAAPGAPPPGEDPAPPAGPASPDGGLAETLGETARLLAAYGWTTLALPIHRLAGEREPLPEDDYSRFRREHWQDPHEPGAIQFLPLVSWLVQRLRGETAPRPDLRLVAPQIGMEDAALAALVRPTAGLVVPYRSALAPALGVLAARWHLWYQADASPADRERPIAVSLLAGGQEVRTARWVRSSTPEAVAAARLRRNLEGDSLAGPLAIGASLLAAPAAPAESFMPGRGGGDVRAAPGPTVVVSRAAPASGEASPTAGPLRVSLAWRDAEGRVLVTHQRLAARDADLWNRGHGLTLTAPRPPAGRQALGVLIENLASELWGCAVVALPEAGGPPAENPLPGAHS
ncbi:MAG TPA: hypothetical protein VHQ90_09685 [Thermoanaerobaculia bacterium]|nr:hypothetical protein [Thermoanaerobaculia bacterium]